MPGHANSPCAASMEPPHVAGTSMLYDVFLSAPMSGFASDLEYRRSRNEILSLVDALRAKATVGGVYYAGNTIASQSEFNSANFAAAADFEALRQSASFVLLYPAKLVSSALVEIGYALALQIPCLILAHRRNDLPYVLTNAGQLSESQGFGRIVVEEFETVADVLPHIVKFVRATSAQH